MKPSIVGKTVHYYPPRDSYGNPVVGPWAAIITAVRPEDGAVCLTAFPPSEPPRVAGWVWFAAEASGDQLQGSGCCTWPSWEEK